MGAFNPKEFVGLNCGSNECLQVCLLIRCPYCDNQYAHSKSLHGLTIESHQCENGHTPRYVLNGCLRSPKLTVAGETVFKYFLKVHCMGCYKGFWINGRMPFTCNKCGESFFHEMPFTGDKRVSSGGDTETNRRNEGGDQQAMS